MDLKTIVIVLLVTELGFIEGLTTEEAVARFFDYFKAENPVGIPVVKFDEPMDLFSPLLLVPITIINGTYLGHSNLIFKQAMVDMLKMEAELQLQSPRIEIGGIYTWGGFFSTSVGAINGTIVEAEIVTNFTMFVNENDTLQFEDTQLKMDNEEVFVNMSNLLWEHELLMATGSLHVFFSDIVQEAFRQMKPLLLHEANAEITKFVANMPPAIKSDEQNRPSFKYFFQRIMNYVGVEPLKLPGQSNSLLGVKFKATNIVLHGMSNVNEVKSCLLFYHDKEFYLESEMVYPKLLLFYKLTLSTGSFMEFDVNEKNQLNNVNLKIKIVIDPSQKKPPTINDLKIDIESFGKIRSGRSGILSFMWNMFLDVADDVRNQIIGALTGPVRNIIQKELNQLDLEKVVLALAKRK